MANKQGLVDRVRKGMNIDAWPDIIKSAMEDINANSINIWIFYSIPRLESWTSKKHRVAILGKFSNCFKVWYLKDGVLKFSNAWGCLLNVTSRGLELRFVRLVDVEVTDGPAEQDSLLAHRNSVVSSQPVRVD
ncbi:hypothetical protein F4801DRAFT_582858 [Xylaria longipes]|nr:hypothetical protein F4801DRAFT_582858 [Xylaria longipes]